MKYRKTRSWLVVTILVTAGVMTPRFGRADEPKRNAEAVAKAKWALDDLNNQAQSQADRVYSYVTGWPDGAPFSRIRVAANVSSSIHKAAEAVRDAKGDDEKSAAQKKLAEVLNKSYDEDMVRREQELKQIEERLAKLRELLERRRAKKQDIIELQTKVALNEAEGLGFYDSDHPTKANPFNVSPLVRVDAFGPPSEAPVPPAPPAGPIPAPRPRSSGSSSSGSAEPASR